MKFLLSYISISFMAKNQFYFLFLANNFDKIWVQNSPILEPWNLLYHLDYIIVQKYYNDTKNAMILKYKYLFCGLLSS